MSTLAYIETVMHSTSDKRFLSQVSNLILQHKNRLLSSIISIPKDMKSSLRDSNNYRGISLFNAICKVYDHAIIFLCYNKFI